MRKVLFFDFDWGLKSIGSDEYILKNFGYTPRRFTVYQSMVDCFNKLFQKKIIVLDQDDLGDIKQEVYALRNNKVVNFFVLDSVTAVQAQKKKDVKGDREKITIADWGIIGEAIENLIINISRTNVNCIVIGHTKPQEDQELGIIKQIPALSGRMANELPRYFDLVAYTHVETDPKTGNRKYYWIMSADERHDAKSRLESVNKYLREHKGMMPQDFPLLWSLIEKDNHKGIKMLILGNPGTGKTYSLRGLKDVVLKDEPKEKKETSTLDMMKEAGQEEIIIKSDQKENSEALNELRKTCVEALIAEYGSKEEAQKVMKEYTGKTSSSELDKETIFQLMSIVRKKGEDDTKPDLQEF